MSAKVLREKYRDDLRTTILDAARELFVSEGYDGFSMRKLATKIEYSPGSIYLYFKNKEELFECLVEESFEQLAKDLEWMRDAKPASSVALLKKGLRAYVDFGLVNPHVYEFTFMIRPPVTDRPYKTHRAFEALRHMVKLCVEQKLFRSVDIAMASQALWAAAHGITSLLIQRPTFPWADKESLIGQVIDTAVDSLLSKKEQVEKTGGLRGGKHGKHD